MLILLVGKPTPAGSTPCKQLQFPETTVGSLYVVPDKQSLAVRKLEGRFLAQARGLVRLPENQNVLLESGYSIVRDPRLLDKIKDGSVQSFRFTNIEGGDEVLQHISHWKSLKRLSLNQTEITDAGIAHLKNLTELEALTLSRDNSTGKTLFNLPLQKLRFLEFSCHEIDRQAVKNIVRFKALRTLDLSRTGLDDESVAAICQLKQLTYLDIGDNKAITDKSAKNIGSLKKLSYLDLRHTSITTRALLSMRLPALEAIILPGWRYTKEEMTALRKNFGSGIVSVKAPDVNLKETQDADLFSPLH